MLAAMIKPLLIHHAKKRREGKCNKVPRILGLDTSRKCSTPASLFPGKWPYISSSMVRMLEGFRTSLDAVLKGNIPAFGKFHIPDCQFRPKYPDT